MPVQNYDPSKLLEALSDFKESEMLYRGDWKEQETIHCWRWNYSNPSYYWPIWIYHVPNETWASLATIETINKDIVDLETIPTAQYRNWLLDIYALEKHMEPDELNLPPNDPPNPLPHHPQHVGAVPKIPTIRIDRKKRYNVNVRIRKKGDYESKPDYSTVALYPAYLLKDTDGESITPDDPRYRSIWIEFGPVAFSKLQAEGEKQVGIAFDVTIPTLDQSLAIYVGTLERKELYHPAQGWYFDIEPSADIIALLHGEVPEDLQVPGVPPGMDPFIAVLRRGEKV